MTAAESEPPADGEIAEDELVTEILARRRRRTPLLTLALVVIVCAAAAFVGGIEAQKHWGGSSSGSGGTNARATFAALAGASGRVGRFSGGAFPSFRAGGGGASVTSGTVTLIKGSTLHVTGSSGTTVLVRTSPSSTVTKTVAGSVKTILPGDTVTVTGTQSKNGTYTARSISVAADE